MNKQNKAQSKSNSFLEGFFLDEYPTKSRFAEAFRTLRTNINFSFMEKEFRTLLITSTTESEGKTNTAANLSFVMARSNKRALMIDADLRKPKLSTMAEHLVTPGLTGLLSDVFNTNIDSGSLSEIGTSDLFRLISFQQKTGILHLTEEREKIDIYFLNGELRDVNWITRPDEKNLGALILKNELITMDQLNQALTRKQNTEQKLGFILVNLGFIKEEELKGFITVHMLEGLRLAISLRSGKFSFKRLRESYFDQPSFTLPNMPLLYSQALIGEEELPYLEKTIFSSILKTGIENLLLLPSGSLPPDPTELLGSKRLSFLISYLKKRFDVLVFDSPPILPASDALVLSPQLDGVLLLVKAGKVNREMAKKAVEQLRIAKANLIGVVLNQVDFKREGYYSYYAKYYDERE